MRSSRVDPEAQEGTLKIRFGLGWAKSHAFFTGQCPVKKYNRGLMMSILHDKAHIADAVNATVIPLDDAPRGYAEFDKGAAVGPGEFWELPVLVPLGDRWLLMGTPVTGEPAQTLN